MQNSEVLPGFISVQDAIEIIRKHRSDRPTVDLRRMMKGYPYILKGNNFNLFLRKVVNGRSVPGGNLPMTLRDQFEVELLKKTLKDKFREVSAHEFDEVSTRTVSISSSVTDDNMSGKPRRTRKSKTKAGDEIVSGQELSSSDFKSGGRAADVLASAVGE